MPERPLSAVFAVNEISEKSVKDIFEDLQNIDVPTHGVRCLQTTAFVLPLARRINTSETWLTKAITGGKYRGTSFGEVLRRHC